jgi:hypothetical protein
MYRIPFSHQCLCFLCIRIFLDCLEYDWAQIISPGKRNDKGNLEFQVKFTDDVIATVDCTMMRGMQEMLKFMKKNGINDENKPPRQWVEDRMHMMVVAGNCKLKVPPGHSQVRVKLKFGDCACCKWKARRQKPDITRNEMIALGWRKCSSYGCPQCNNGKGVLVCANCWEGYQHHL